MKTNRLPLHKFTPLVAGLMLLTADLSLLAQPADGARGEPGRQGGRRGGGGRGVAQPDDATGFVSIFDGKTLDGWDGDPTFWRAEDGEIIGQSTP